MKQFLKNITCALAMLTMTTGQYVAAQTPTNSPLKEATRIQRMKTSVKTWFSKPHPYLLGCLIACLFFVSYFNHRKSKYIKCIEKMYGSYLESLEVEEHEPNTIEEYKKQNLQLKQKKLELEQNKYKQADRIYDQMKIINKYKKKYPNFDPNADQL